MPLEALQQRLSSLGVQVTPEQQELLRLSEQMARNFGERLLAGQLPLPLTPMGRQFQLQMMQQLLQADRDRYLPAVRSHFQRLFPTGEGREDIRVSPATRQQALQFATMLGTIMQDPAAAMAMVPRAWGYPTIEQTLQEIMALNQMLSPFGGVLGPTGVMVDPGEVVRLSLFGVMLQALIDALRDVEALRSNRQ